MIDLLLSPLSFLIFIPLALGAIAENGVLGTTRGKVGNVVFSTWKGINTVRAKVDPANPQTQAQQDNRNKFGRLAKFGSGLLSPLIQPLWDDYKAQESGFNSWLKANTDYANNDGDLTQAQMVPNNSVELENASGTYDASTEQLDLTWNNPGPPYESHEMVAVVLEQHSGGAFVKTLGAPASAESGTIELAQGSYWVYLVAKKESIEDVQERAISHTGMIFVEG